MNHKIGMTEIVLIAIGIVGIYLTGVGMCILYFDYPMNLGKVMNRDGLLFILTGTVGTLWAVIFRIRMIHDEKQADMEKMIHTLMGRIDDLQDSMLKIHNNQIALTHRVFNLEKHPDSETETGIEPKRT